MIDLSELRFGNLYFKRVGKSEPVLSVINGYVMSEIYSPNSDLSFNDFEPVPINRGGLEAFGFLEMSKDNYIKHFISEDEPALLVRLRYVGNGNWRILIRDCFWEVVDLSSYEVRFIHQIQNLYQALSGEELKFQL